MCFFLHFLRYICHCQLHGIHLGFHVKIPSFLLDFNAIWSLWTDLHEVPKFHENLSRGSRDDICAQTNRETSLI
jgi:hypothetical protein